MRLGVVIITWWAAASALAAPTPRVVVSAKPPPVMVMIRTASTPDARRREASLYDELSLVLDGFEVLSIPAPSDDFATRPLADQLAAVLPDARDNEAVALLWMSFPLPRQVLVHLVVLGSGRALVRSIETDRTSESSIALIARELLGTAYLFEPAATLPAEMKDVVHSVKAEIAAAEVATAPVAPPPADAPRPWEVWATAALRAPLAGGADAVPYGQLQLGVGRAVRPLQLGVSVDLGFAPIARPNTAAATFLVAGLAASGSWGFSLGASQFTLGPRLAAGLDAGFFFAGAQRLTQLLPRVALGLEARTHRPGPAFALAMSVVYSPVGAELVAGSASPLYRTPILEFELAGSFGWEGL